MSVSLLFPAFNRLEFTRQSWTALMVNTDWSLVSEFHIYDDGSTDGTREWLRNEFDSGPFGEWTMESQFHTTSFRSPMGVTLDWIKRSRAPMLAKLDNDTIYPPGWLNIAMDVMKRHPELGTLGLECMRKPAQWHAGHPTPGVTTDEDAHGWYGERTAHATLKPVFGYLPAIYISGLGLYRREIFRDSLPADSGYFGFEEWMEKQAVKHGWILPSLPTILLDRLPIEPWATLSEQYVRKGWQRAWSGAGPLRYKVEQHEMWDWWRPC